MKKRYLKSLKIDLKEINWTNLSYNLIYNLLEFKKNPDIEFIFKSKKLFFKDVNLQSKSQESIVYNSKLNNCKLAFDVDSRKLIEKAKCNWF